LRSRRADCACGDALGRDPLGSTGNSHAPAGTPIAIASDMTDVRAKLTRDHEELERLLRRLAEDGAAPEPGALLATWCEFETRLLAHMDAEERYLLPLVQASNPLVAERTRSEHAQIRGLVSALGVAIELHTARQPAIADLIALLRSHSEHEDRVLYALASERAPAHVRDKISAALKAARRFALANETAAKAGGEVTRDA
jgi:hypothetical protein